jgi:cytoskeletal protein CcmA (bactofilin family)
MSSPRHALDAALSIPRKASIEGSLDFPGPVVIEGTVIGDVSCTSLIVAERGVVEGTIKADAVTVLGEVSGEIFANHLTLKSASSVAADIFHKHLLLEDGCYFEGKSRRHANPLQLAS